MSMTSLFLSVPIIEHVPSSQSISFQVVPACVDSNACYSNQETSCLSHLEIMSSSR
ncbi:uncharacterized protein LACBIDRAFT_308040 [Laccaria bicolor S238N-H82]|uniref:Predicted protein n=1 Tax=Laccaria bicolor (strain S238N-H82 / ATCC MYA-4686) TaxID=486041 RepID=B0DRH7_LACBS|nr:uncharacterized protein LACBIDRAFT_308040 [Laccaria bicolor S238N-H82]EDR02873.1 predicted protein [Laccaria bicolor S238N-H82]|eukprot:XP_001886583.1 predicted protein [Laccaria bicolor S238N-H82]